MVQQKPVGMHKIIFTITCEGETLYDAQKIAGGVSSALETYGVKMPSAAKVEMAVEQNVIPLDTTIDTVTSTLPNDIQLSFTGNCECSGVEGKVHKSYCSLSNNT